MLEAWLLFVEQAPSWWYWGMALLTQTLLVSCKSQEADESNSSFLEKIFRSALTSLPSGRSISETPFAYPSQDPSESSLISSTTTWQFSKLLCIELQPSN